MADIDKISMVLGELTSDAKAARNQRESIFKMLAEVQKTVATMPSLITQVNHSSAEIHKLGPVIVKLEDLVKTVGVHDNHIKDYVALKNKGLGIIAFVGLMGGGIAAGIGKILDWGK